MQIETSGLAGAGGMIGRKGYFMEAARLAGYGSGTMTSIRFSVIIRAKNEAEGIGECIDLVRAQDWSPEEVEIIVVDSGSQDGTQDIARARGASLIKIPAESFTFGGALNTGCATARGELLVALSAHAFVRDPRWLRRLDEVFSDPNVACASGSTLTPERGPLRGRLRQREADFLRNPELGYSNAAGGFRADLWRQRPFRPEMPGTEDKEWAWHWLRDGFVTVLEPALVVDHEHAFDPLPDMFERSRREWAGYRTFLPLPPYGARQLVREWWAGDQLRPPWRARLSPRRSASLAGKYCALR